MRNLFLFMMVSLDGYFAGTDGDLSWHTVDEEFNEFAIDQLNHIDVLLFGRVTYQLMAGYWPTPAARADDPVVAGKMNSLPKLVFSRTLDQVEWENSRLIGNNIAEAVARLKEQPGQDMAIFGSSDLTVSLLRAGLVDELRIMVSPVVLGKGKLLFQGFDDKLDLKLERTRSFHNGNVLLVYRPVKK